MVVQHEHGAIANGAISRVGRCPADNARNRVCLMCAMSGDTYNHAESIRFVLKRSLYERLIVRIANRCMVRWVIDGGPDLQ